jgi:hypothetical protein
MSKLLIIEDPVEPAIPTLFGSKFESYLNQRHVKKIVSEEDFDLDE